MTHINVPLILIYYSSDSLELSDIRREFDSKPKYKKKFLKTKMWSYGGEVRDFHDKEVPIAGSNQTCLLVVCCRWFRYQLFF